MSQFKINSITSKSGDHGPVIAGVSTNNSTGCMIIPKGNSSNRVGVSTYVLNGTIPSEGLRILLDAGDINSNDTSDPENVWRNLSDHPTKGDFRFDTIGRVTRTTGATGSIELDGNANGAIIGEELCSDLFPSGGGTLFLILKPDDVSTRQTIISGYLNTSGINANRWDFEISSNYITGGNHSADYYSATSTISADTTVTLGIVLDNSADRLSGITTDQSGNVQKLYLNGSLNSTRVQPENDSASWAAPVYLSLGRRAQQKANFEYNGEFFVFIAYDSVLDDDEMLQLHNAFKDRYGL
jgi:hypothetical protein|tara:strand:+ start:2192 stop:3085 length:894 start_codon:yes stop_codon:yes gene_type:complete